METTHYECFTHLFELTYFPDAHDVDGTDSSSLSAVDGVAGTKEEE